MMAGTARAMLLLPMAKSWDDCCCWVAWEVVQVLIKTTYWLLIWLVLNDVLWNVSRMDSYAYTAVLNFAKKLLLPCKLKLERTLYSQFPWSINLVPYGRHCLRMGQFIKKHQCLRWWTIIFPPNFWIAFILLKSQGWMNCNNGEV